MRILTILLLSSLTLLAQEVEVPLKAIRVEMKCGQACRGKMVRIPGSGVLNSHPPQYQHQCSKCKRHANLFEAYPVVRFVEPEHTIKTK